MFATLSLWLMLIATVGEKRPNVLWICADDHAAYVYGAFGNPKVRTPNLDRLAASGMRFDRAYSNSPVCTASRQSFLTGRYPRTIGVTLLQTALPESEVSLAELLQGAGYTTAAIGKMHFNSNLNHGFERRIDQPEYRAWLETVLLSRYPKRLPCSRRGSRFAIPPMFGSTRSAGPSELTIPRCRELTSPFKRFGFWKKGGSSRFFSW